MEEDLQVFVLNYNDETLIYNAIFILMMYSYRLRNLCNNRILFKGKVNLYSCKKIN